MLIKPNKQQQKEKKRNNKEFQHIFNINKI